MKCKKGVDAPKYAPEFFAASCKGASSPGPFFGSRVWAPALQLFCAPHHADVSSAAGVICTGTGGGVPSFSQACACMVGTYVNIAFCLTPQ